MLLEDYFDFLARDDIRIRGHRIGIETILYEYIHRARTPEEIQREYTTLTLDEVYATILYYLRNKEAVSAYLTNWIEFGRRMRAEQARNPSAAILRLRELKRQRAAAEQAQREQETSTPAPRCRSAIWWTTGPL
jgi:uncharacterized protein (DUF433 family)